jgi:hypothetical protein
LGYNNEFPGLGTKGSQLYSNSVRRCGPNQERTPQRELGCTSDLPPGSPYGAEGSPGPGPQQYAYRGSSLGPPDEPLGDVGCDYKLSYKDNLQMGYECYNLPPLGGVRVLDAANAPLNLGFSVSGRRLPTAEWRDRLAPYYQKWYDSAPLRWGFEQGTFFPYWELRSVGMPNFVVKKHCYLDAHAGREGRGAGSASRARVKSYDNTLLSTSPPRVGGPKSALNKLHKRARECANPGDISVGYFSI